MQTSGNTQAYALGSLDKLLELDIGWECVDALVIEKVGQKAYNEGLSEIRASAIQPMSPTTCLTWI